MKKVVGFTAPPEFVALVNQIADDHDRRLLVDCVRAYHVGARFNIEMEIVLPGNSLNRKPILLLVCHDELIYLGDMSVRDSHDIALALQHKLEVFIGYYYF